MISPTTHIDTEDEDTTDTDDSDEDDESVNIYEEALNCENPTYMNRPSWVKPRAQIPPIHKVRLSHKIEDKDIFITELLFPGRK